VLLLVKKSSWLAAHGSQRKKRIFAAQIKNMIFPIVAYGAAVLRKVSQDITPDYPGLKTLIDDMWETMYASSGVGLAAPQINKDIRLFVMDSAQIFENLEEDEKGVYPDAPGIKQVFINAHVVSLDGEEWAYNEGCLSIPKIREDVLRAESVTLEFVDENFKPYTQTFNGITARVILHEYDHTEGKLFIDYLKPLRRKMLQGKLNDISKGKVKIDYKMIFPK
jgi:peptide deformylase